MRDEGTWDWGREAQPSQLYPEASWGLQSDQGAAPTLQSFDSVPHPLSLGTLLVLCLSLHFQHIPRYRTGCRQMGSSAPHPMGSSTTTPKRELGASPAWGDCSLLMPGPAEHLEESQLEAVTCQHSLGAHLALLPREIPASLYPVFFSFWLNFCCSPCAVPSCCPATAQGGVTVTPLAALPSLPAGSLSLTGHCSQGPVYDEEEDALPQGCLSLTVLHSAP